MKINSLTNILSKPRILGPAVFLGVGVIKTCCDYQKAKPEKKKRVMLKDTAILAGSVAAFAIVSPVTRFFCNTGFVSMFLKASNKLVTKFMKNPLNTHNSTASQTKRIMQNTEHILKEGIAGTINTFAGITGAIYANEIMHKYVFSKPPFYTDKIEVKQVIDSTNQKNSQKGFFEGSRVFNNFDYVNKQFAKDTASKVFSTIADMPNMKLLEKPMIALTGFSVANTKGYHNKLKKTSYELLANTLIPTIFVSAMSLAVEHKKSIIKYPALFGALSFGAFIGTKVANVYRTKINETIDSIDMKYLVV